MTGGYIKIHRQMLNWEWMGEPNVVTLWVNILLMANWEDKKWCGIVIPRGSFVTSVARLAKATGLSVQQTRTGLKKLESTHEVTIRATKKFTIVTICKYDDYQSFEDIDQQTHQQNEQQSNNKQITTTKESKEIYINNKYTHAHAREDWRFISSVLRSHLGNDNDSIAEYKQKIFRQEVEDAAQAIGMTDQQKDAFVRWWTEHSPGSDQIRADYEVTFDTESRMRNWMERDRQRQMPARQQPQQKSRMDSLKDDMDYIHRFFNGQQQESTTTPDEQ